MLTLLVVERNERVCGRSKAAGKQREVSGFGDNNITRAKQSPGGCVRYTYANLPCPSPFTPAIHQITPLKTLRNLNNGV